jgi:hypothetical protein
MPTLTARKPKAKPRTGGSRAKTTTKRVRSPGPSIGEWAKKYSGIMKGAPSDLSMREGFGD